MLKGKEEYHVYVHPIKEFVDELADLRMDQDNADVSNALDSIQAYMDILRKVLKTDSWYEKDGNTSTNRYVTVAAGGHILEKGDILRRSPQRTETDKEEYIYQSTTHPRKVSTVDESGRYHTYYANVHNVGIWDRARQEWSFDPPWRSSHVTPKLRKLDN